MDQHSYEYQDPTDTPTRVPIDFEVSYDHSLHPGCTHNPMTMQYDNYPIPNRNLALAQLLEHHICDFYDPTDTPGAVPTSLQAPNDHTYKYKCAHNPM